MPFKQKIPLLYRHGRPAGEVQEVRSTDKGLYVRALVTDSEARRCTHFSLAATVRSFQLREADDPKRFHGLITCDTLDEISLTNAPANAAATVMQRYRPSAAVDMYTTMQRWAACMSGIMEALRVINAANANAEPASLTPRVEPPPQGDTLA
jgi:hypothetical protein